jgi:hypothetical protein
MGTIIPSQHSTLWKWELAIHAISGFLLIMLILFVIYPALYTNGNTSQRVAFGFFVFFVIVYGLTEVLLMLSI